MTSVRAPPPCSLPFTQQPPQRSPAPTRRPSCAARARPALTPRARAAHPFSRVQYAFIMRVSEPPLEGEAFAVIELRAGDNVGILLKRTCQEFTHWGVHAGQVHLFLAAAGGEDPPPLDALVAAAADPASCLGVGWPLARAGIVTGCWLLARVPPPATTTTSAFLVRASPFHLHFFFPFYPLPPRSTLALQRPSMPPSPRLC